MKDDQKPAAQEPGSETATQTTQETSKNTSKGKKNTERKTRKAVAREARRAATLEKERKRAEQAELRAKATKPKTTKAKGKPDVASAISKGPQLTPAQKARTATNADRESAGNVAFLLNESHKRVTGSINKEQLALAREFLFCLFSGSFADFRSFGCGNAESPASFLWPRESAVQVSSFSPCDANVD